MRPDYCPVANEPCQCVCMDGCRIKKNSRKPLTDEEIHKLKYLHDYTAGWSLESFARAIERAHGIGSKDEQ